MPDQNLPIPAAVEAAEAVHDALYPEIPKGHDKMPRTRALWIDTYARIIANKMAPVVEAAYREGRMEEAADHGVAIDDATLGLYWKHSKARAALGKKEGG